MDGSRCWKDHRRAWVWAHICTAGFAPAAQGPEKRLWCLGSRPVWPQDSHGLLSYRMPGGLSSEGVTDSVRQSVKMHAGVSILIPSSACVQNEGFPTQKHFLPSGCGPHVFYIPASLLLSAPSLPPSVLAFHLACELLKSSNCAFFVPVSPPGTSPAQNGTNSSPYTLALGGLGALVTRCHWAETPRVGHKATFPSSQRYRSPGGPSPGSHVHSLYWEHFGARGSTGHVEREDAWPPNRQCPRRCPVPKGATPGSCPRPPCSPARHLHHGVRKQRRRGSQLAPCISPTPAWSQSYLDGEEVLHFHRPSLSGCADQLDGARLPSQTVGCLTAGSAKPHASPQP